MRQGRGHREKGGSGGGRVLETGYTAGELTLFTIRENGN